MLVNEKNVVLETGVHVRLQSKLDNCGVVMTVDVCIHSIQSLEYLTDQRGKRLGERDA